MGDRWCARRYLERGGRRSHGDATVTGMTSPFRAASERKTQEENQNQSLQPTVHVKNCLVRDRMYKFLTDRVLTKTDDAHSVRRQSGGRRDKTKSKRLHKIRMEIERNPSVDANCAVKIRRDNDLQLRAADTRENIGHANKKVPRECLTPPSLTDCLSS